MEKHKKKYTCIAKVGTQNLPQFVKYRCNDLNNFIQFITKKYDVYYFNVFSNKGTNKNLMLYTWGKHKGLQPSY